MLAVKFSMNESNSESPYCAYLKPCANDTMKPAGTMFVISGSNFQGEA